MFHCNGWCTGWSVVAVGGTQVCLRDVIVHARRRRHRDGRFELRAPRIGGAPHDALGPSGGAAGVEEVAVVR
jgi:hypothetical protein